MFMKPGKLCCLHPITDLHYTYVYYVVCNHVMHLISLYVQSLQNYPKCYMNCYIS